MKKALITGITGQDGSYLAELLLKKGYDVHGLIRRTSHHSTERIDHILDRINVIYGDVTDSFSVYKALKEADPNEFYNLAAQSFVGSSWLKPEHTCDINAVGVVKILEAIKHYNKEMRFYQASTSELYGRAYETPQNEKTPFYPRSPYAFSKLMAYWATVNYRESYEMYAVNGILFNHESPRRGLEFVTRKISYEVARIKLGLSKTIKLGNLDAKRDWGYAPEYVEAMWLMLQQNTPQDFVIGSGQSHSVREFLQKAFETASIENFNEYVETDQKFMRPAEVDELVADSNKARTVLGWKPKTSFDELVRIMVEADIELLSKRG